MTRVLVWLIKAFNRLLWSGFYFLLPPNEADKEEMRLYDQRATW